jgi:hypothetical protein
MDNHSTGGRMSTPRARPAAAYPAPLLGAVGGLWLAPGDGPRWETFLGVVALALAAVAGVVWLARARAARRLRAATDAHAAREAARQRRWKARNGAQTFSTRGGG